MENYPILQTVIVAVISGATVLIVQHFLKRYLPGLAKLEIHLSDKLGLSFDNRGHVLVLYGSIYSKFSGSFVKKMVVTLYPENSTEHFDFKLDLINMDLTTAAIPAVAFPVFERGGILFATFKNEKTSRNVTTVKSEWYRGMDTYSKQFTGGIDSIEFQTTYHSQQTTKELVKKIREDIFFWKDGKYKLELKVFKDQKSKPKIWSYEFTLSFDDMAGMKNNANLIATIYPSSYKGAPLFYNAFCEVIEISKQK